MEMSGTSTSVELLEDFSGDEEPNSPTYGALGTTDVRQRDRRNADQPDRQRGINRGELASDHMF